MASPRTRRVLQEIRPTNENSVSESEIRFKNLSEKKPYLHLIDTIFVDYFVISKIITKTQILFVSSTEMF